jgi:hypothetical protein
LNFPALAGEEERATSIATMQRHTGFDLFILFYDANGMPRTCAA